MLLESSAWLVPALPVLGFPLLPLHLLFGAGAVRALWDGSLDPAEVWGSRTSRFIKGWVRDLVSHPAATFPCLLAVSLKQARQRLAHRRASSSHQQGGVEQSVGQLGQGTSASHQCHLERKMGSDLSSKYSHAYACATV